MAVATFEYHQARNVRVPLLSAAVGIGPDGSRVMLVPGSPVVLHPGTRVLSGPGTDAEARRQAAWLALGTVPGRQGPHHDMVRSALLDLDTLRLTNGAAIAAWPTAWRYVWPRDASFAAVALARTGHPNDALQMMEFVQSQQPPSGLLQARYRPDGSGPPDARGEVGDGPVVGRRTGRGCPGRSAEAALVADRTFNRRGTGAHLGERRTASRIP